MVPRWCLVKPALMLIHRGEDGMVTPMPFTYRTGELMAVIEEVADYIAGMELVDSLYEGIAADRLRTILEQRVQLKDAKEVILSLQRQIEIYKEHPELAVFA